MLQHPNKVRQAAVNWTGDEATANGMNGNKGATAVNNTIEGLGDKVV